MTWIITVALVTGALSAFRFPHVAFEIIGVALSFSAAVVLWRSLRPRGRQPDVELYDDVMVLPVGRGVSRTVQYEALRGALTRGRAPKDELVLEAEGRTYVYPRQLFADEDGLDVFFSQLRNRLSRHPRGAQIVAEIRHRENLARRSFQIRPRMTHGLLALIVVVFVLQGVLGGVRNPIVAAQLGANVFEKTLSGDWYRLFTANFLHGGLLHIYLNGLALFSLGGALERLLGRWTYLTVFLVSAVGGALTSAFFAPGPMSMGASTALFGLLGAFGVLHLERALPLGYRQTGGWWIFTLGVNAILPLIVEVIDVAAHVGGFVVGAGVTWLIFRFRRGIQPRSDRRLLRPAIVLALVYLAAFVNAGVAAASFGPRDEVEVARSVFDPQLARIIDDYEAHPSDERRMRLALAFAESASLRGTAWLGGASGSARAEGGPSSLALNGSVPSDSLTWVLAHRDSDLIALLRVCVGSGVELPVVSELSSTRPELDEPTDFAVVAVDGRRTGVCPAGAVEVDAWPLPDMNGR